MLRLEGISTSTRDSVALARVIAQALMPGDIVLFDGELGAGKTLFIRAIAEAMGVDPAVISSPTFVLANEYEARDSIRLVHMDAYRLGGQDELTLLGWDRLVSSDTVVLIEWADRIADLVQKPTIRFRLEHVDEDARLIAVELPGSGDRWARVLGWFEQNPAENRPPEQA